ncbi:molybdenum cofactor guanylyltransferase [Taibaiella lutea]|uniref:Probable molybdenum cofactor guanylyltransferase n=1 Tax=Taibaiella lutea TaxID=2608001 RepID=A0A5M6CJC0_9BACT|nr:molybdenum cofactor guanylyltransferase [Taibaiella lutea]KAA5535137.1 molybdenum cofactor guanylyltransferase [Taibaiella lutea]
MNQTAMTGIVVCGGKSSRMGTDKSMLRYYDEPQRYHIAKLLQPFCTDVYISLNNNQEEVHEYKIIRDNATFDNLGPMTGLLSAYDALPDKNFLFIGCDYPLLTAEELSLFVQSINQTTKASAFFNKAENLYEPLLAYYPSGFGQELKDYFLQGNNSLQKLLFRSAAERYIPMNKDAFRSVDNQVDFEEVMAIIRK